MPDYARAYAMMVVSVENMHAGVTVLSGPVQKAASCARGRGRERDSSGGVISNRP